MERFHWRAALICAGLVGVIALILLLTIDPSQRWGGDNSMYIMHAINIATGQPYNATGYIQNPHRYLAPQAYPPMFPMLLAPVYALYGFDIHAMKLLMVGLFIASLCAVAYCYRDEFSGRWATLYWLLLIAVLGLDPKIAYLGDTMLSDAPFLFFVYLSLIVLKHAYARLDESADNIVVCIVAGFCIYLAVATRIFGFLLLASTVAYEIIRYRWLTRVALITSTVCLTGYTIQSVVMSRLHTAVGGANQGYGAIMHHDLVDRLWSLPASMAWNLAVYAYHFCNGFYSGYGDDVAKALGLMTLFLATAGFVWRVASRYSIVDVFVVVYLLGLLPWSSATWRYALPIVPAYCFYLLVALIGLQRYLRLRYPILVVGVAAVIGAPFMFYYAPRLWNPPEVRATAPNSTDAFALYRAIDSRTRADDIIIFRKPRTLALYTGRRSSVYAEQPDLASLAYFDRIGARYIVSDPPDRQDQVQTLVQRHPSRFKRVFSNTAFRLYAIMPAGGSTASGMNTQVNAQSRPRGSKAIQ